MHFDNRIGGFFLLEFVAGKYSLLFYLLLHLFFIFDDYVGPLALFTMFEILEVTTFLCVFAVIYTGSMSITLCLLSDYLNTSELLFYFF